ncbi:MAG: cytochrome P460 family protein [Opitutaceae bacterium]
MKTPRFVTLLALAFVSSLFAAEVAKDRATGNDRVPFPKDYTTAFQEIRVSNKTGQTLLGSIYANAPAASVGELAKLPYPYGSVVVMEWAQPVKGANGELLLDANGNWKKGAVVRVDVMRREKDFGTAYGDKRAGEWEFASYRPDGSAFTPAINAASCAECHAKAAERDFVFRGRFPAIENK